MNALLLKVGEELCNAVWEKTEHGGDDRFQVDDLAVIFAAACAKAIGRSSDPSKAAHAAVDAFGAVVRAYKVATTDLPVQ